MPLCHVGPEIDNTIIFHLSTHFEPEPLVRTLLILFSRPSDLMNRNKYGMKLEATCLTESKSATDIKRL